MSDPSCPAVEPQIFEWLKVTVSDLEDFDFEHVLQGSSAADCLELAALYRDASSKEVSKESPKVRVFDFLSSVSGMRFTPHDQNEPFGPMLLLADGRRSAKTEDFRNHVDVLRTLASKAKNVVLRARLSDLAWFLERSNAAAGAEAIKAYVDVVRRVQVGELRFRNGDSGGLFHPHIRDCILRALRLARILGWSKSEAEEARACLLAIRDCAFSERANIAVLWYSNIDLDNGITEPLNIAVQVEKYVDKHSSELDYNIAVDLWRLASRAFHYAKKEDDKLRCKVMAAEVMAANAEKMGSSMLAAHVLANAIAQLHGVPSARERRTQLRHRLVEVQASIGDEFDSVSHELDISDLVAHTRSQFEMQSVYDSLFAFACLDQSPHPDQLRAEAIRQMRAYPLATLFTMTHLDDEGKIIHRSGGGGDEHDDGSIVRQISQHESVRRVITVTGCIEPARIAIISNHYISEEILINITSRSPFIPYDLKLTFARGFSRFFVGDFTSAIYILAPLLEDSLRYVLKACGHDVTTFDSADQTQKDRNITALFNGMRAELDGIFTRAVTDELLRVFLERPGPAIRHSVAHGLLRDESPFSADAIYACWLIFRLCVLPLYPRRQKIGLD